jgi:negative regulator of sigma E activity
VSAGWSDEVDIDLLADYVGGALDGMPDERVVARLIADDPQWAQAYARLVRESDMVRRTLTEWGAAPAPMPPDIVERLSAHLISPDARPDPAGGRHPAPTAPRSDPTHPPSRLDAEAARPAVRKARRRLPRWAKPVAVAAALLAIAAVGVSQLGGDIRATDNTTGALSRDAGQPQSAEGGAGTGAQPFAAPSPDRLLATGKDYAPGPLIDQARALGSATAAKASANDAPPVEVPDATGGEPAPTTGATRRGDLAACLSSIAAEHGRGMPHFEVVDYARFEGQPALLVVFTDPAGQRWVWAVAPECGQPSAGAAARYTARVG